MSLDYQQVQEQVRELGQQAKGKQAALRELRQIALRLLSEWANEQVRLREKVRRVAASYDPNLRCAIPPDPALREFEALNAAQASPPLPAQATILAADGSQIPVDRHAEVLYCLVNVGAIQMQLGAAEPPSLIVESRLMYDEHIFTPFGLITDSRLALLRDEAERDLLTKLARTAVPPIISFTDGPVELWGAKGSEASDFSEHLDAYLESLRALARLGATVAGYVDKPLANLVVRLLEIAITPESDLPEIKERFPLRGVNDLDLFRHLLKPGQRSAVFGMQSQSARQYRDELALHFFYLNVGREKRPWLARVELPAWVAGDAQKLDALQAVLVDQCRMMGSPYPYLLHRAHETALVTFEEREQVTQMIALELRNRQVEVGEQSYKQANKELAGRQSYR